MVARLEVAGHVAPRAHLRRVLEHLLHHQRVPPGRAASRGKARAAESRALREQLAADSRVAAAALLSARRAARVGGDVRDRLSLRDRDPGAGRLPVGRDRARVDRVRARGIVRAADGGDGRGPGDAAARGSLMPSLFYPSSVATITVANIEPSTLISRSAPVSGVA